ncbi:MAG TPA: Stk1 family PASTA domain-containing Ser/Thr kinase [Acidimicrobiales bacterium]|nr:Stk1 family PASTA domain-containing Ser/Thr kinase [Acidimicrobiales bacterium]
MTSPPLPLYGSRYALGEQIARGGTAQVFAARDQLLDRPVAVKVLFPELSSDHSFVERFRREAQAAANLSHQNIVPVFDWGEADSTYYIVMELVDGEPLSSIIRSQGPLDPVQAASIASDIARALAYAHRHGVVHRDVKPGNVLITADGQVKVTDFGIARAMGSDEQVTQTGLVMGTATYFSPEQAQGLEVDGRSDVYSLGVVLYEMVTGRPPFTGENPVAIAYQHVREEPPAPRSLNPAVPVALDAIIRQAMAKLPAERYRSADELRADLDRFVRGQTVLAAPPDAPATVAIPRQVPAARGTVDRYDTDRGRSTTPWWVAAGAALTLAIAAVVYFGGRSLGWFGAAAYVRVPHVVGMARASAEATLRASGLRYRVDVVAGSATDAGRVLRQRPDAPATARQGSQVLLEVAGPAPVRPLPPLVGLTVAQAEVQLRAAGFTAAPKVVYVPATSADQRQLTVISQSPASGSTARVDTVITLDVVKGTKLVTVPNLTGDSPAQAGAALATAGLNVAAQLNPVFSPTVPAGEVVSTSPPAGASVASGTTVTLNVSNAVTVPNVVSLSLQEAESQLSAAGLNYRVAEVPAPATDQVGLVTNQSPLPGKVVRPLATVTIFVGVASSTGTSPGTGSTGPPPPGNSGGAPGQG